MCQKVNTYGKKNSCFASTAAAVRIGYEEHMPGQVSVKHSVISRIMGLSCIQSAITCV